MGGRGRGGGGGGGLWHHHPGGGGHSGSNRYCQTDARSRSGEREDLGAVNSFWGKKGGGQLQTKNIIGSLAYNLCLYSLYFIRYMAFFIWKAV